MHVQVIGLEKSSVQYADITTTTESDERTYHYERTETAHAQRLLIQADVSFNHLQMIQNGRIPPGKYRLPFDIELPRFLPSSMAETGDGGNCAIVYKLKAILQGSGRIDNYTCEHDFVVKAQPLEKMAQPFEGEPISVNAKFCCWFNRGAITVGAYMKDTVLKKGETAKLALSCRKYRTVGVDKVEAKLVQLTRWTAGAHSNSQTRILQNMDFDTQGMNREVKSPERCDIGPEYQFQMLEELREGSNAHMVTMSPSAFNTYQGQVMSVHHELRILVTTSGCIDNPEIVIPIRAGESGNASTPPPHAPVAVSVSIPQGFLENAVQASVNLVEQDCLSTYLNGSCEGRKCAAATGMASVPSGQICTAASEGDYEVFVIPAAGGQIFTGGAAIAGDNEEFVIPAAGEATPVSLATLFKEMNDSVADLEFVRRRIDDASWASVFQNMSPTDYGKMIKLVDLDFDQATVAALVAEHIPNVTSEYVAAAARAASEWNRTTVVEKLIPLCTDLALNKQIILDELSDWEKTVTERAFQKVHDIHLVSYILVPWV
jgi:hypothetical protein